MTTFTDLNAQLNLPQDGVINLKADKEAVRAYFIEYVNKHTRFFHSLREKTDYMLENELWSRDTVEVFPFEDFKELFKVAYSYKFRFESTLGAIKFYSTYALKDIDGETILERFEDRVVMASIHLSGGDLAQAEDLIRVIVTGRFQPATPTFLNAGRAKGGEMVSCFLLRMEDNLESIARVYASGMQLSKRGGGVGILLTNMRESGAPLKGIPGVGRGIVPIMKNLEDQFSHIDQLGMRQGAGAVYLNAHHPDIMQFLDTKRENADEKIRIKTLSLGVVIPDITFHLARDNKDMYLFSPYDVERVEGKPMSECSVTENYHKWVEDERITKKKVSARRFFQTLSEIQFESGYPYILFEDTANKFHPMKHAGKINLSNLCVTGDTEILTEHGYRKAIDLYESREDFNVIVDERARTMNITNRGTSITASSKMYKTATNAKIFKVTTHEGHEIKATPWHKFYVDRDGELVKIPLHEVVEGDRLLVQSGENPTWGTIYEPDLAYIAGVMAADGTYGGKNRDGLRIDLYGDKDQFKDVIEQAVHRLLDGREDLCERQATTKPEFSQTPSNDGKMKWSLNSTPLGKLLGEHGVGASNKVSVPDFVKRGSRETQQAFINGVWQMDGCITGNKKYSVRSFELGSIEQDFLKDMQKLLLGFGVYTRIYDSKKVGGLTLLPDGKGGEDYYYQSRSWTLRANSKPDCSKLFGLVNWRKASREKWAELMAGASGRSWTQHKFRATVKSIEFVGVDDVYDVTVDDGNSVIFNGIVTGNCSEIAQLNTPSTMTDDLTYTHVGDDISCNLGSLNVQKMLELDRDEFIGTVRVAVRALDQVSRLTDIDAVPTVAQGNRKSRAIGLGQMNLHGALAHNMLEYGSDEALTLWDNYMALVTYAAMLESVELAKEYGTHAYWDGCEYHTGEWFRRTTDVWLEKNNHEAPTILGVLRSPSVVEWDDLEDAVRRNGMANAYLQTIPPTGSISYINNSTSSIHPIASKIEIRKEGKIGRVYYPAPHMRTENLHLYKDAYELGYEKLIDTYAVSQHWIDQSQSCTLFLKAEATTRDLDRARIYAWRKGLKSIYYIRLRQLGLEGTEVGEDVDECVACQL